MKQQQNNEIKDQKSKIKNTYQRSKITDFLFVILMTTFLFLNFVSSQLISPIYFQFVNNNKNSTISFLQKIKTLPEYSRILEMNNNIYGPTVKGEIYTQENKKKELINNLEQQLTINPKARDVLYGLYKLYLAEGNQNKATDYLRRAREVDPVIIK